MKKVKIVVMMVMLSVVFSGCETLKMEQLSALFGGSSWLSTEKIIAGLKEALNVGIEKSTKKLSQPGGFANNKKYYITLPDELKKVTKTLRKVGLGSLVDDFENKMNVAVEKATASALPIFKDAILNMSFDDAKKILNGGDTAATDYLKAKTSAMLMKQYKPIITHSMKDVGALKIYNDLLAKYDAIPFKSKPNLSLEKYVTEKGLDALFSAVAEQETAIRKDPVARTTELLKQVFGN
jgi:hypothetical protein